MPYCRFCHEEISRFDKDICPKCGGKNPIDPNYETMDVTRDLKKMGGDFNPPKTKRKGTYVILCMVLGYLGAHSFYIGRKKYGAIDILVTVVLVLAVGLPLFLTVLKNALAFLLPFLAIWIYYLIKGIYINNMESPKDAHGEFLR